MTLEIGQMHKLTTDAYSGNAKVVGFYPVYVGDKKGHMVQYDIDGYAKGIEFFVPDNIILDSAIESRQSRSYMPKEYMSKTSKDFDWTLYDADVAYQKKIAQAFVQKFSEFLRQGRGLYIYSNTKGSGKTMLACCIANEVIKRRDISVKFTSVIEYLELVRDKNETSRDKLNEIINATLLIVDDIGATVEDKEWISNSLFRLVNRRYENILPTIFTSNVPAEKLKCGDRVVSRIEECSVPLIMPEQSIRKQKAKRHNDDFLKGLFDN